MALGGGSFSTQNKKLPGAYLNFASVTKSSSVLSDRGIATIPLELDWGVDEVVFEVSCNDFINNCSALFGHDYSSDSMKALRDVFLYAKTLYCYKLNYGGQKASCIYATAKYTGTRGNDLKIVIQTNTDDTSKFDVKTVLDTTVVDSQTVDSAQGLVDNDYVTFDTGASLEITAGTALTEGTNGTIDGSAYQSYLDKIESYNFNVMGVPTTDETIKQLCVNFVKRMRDEIGLKFQVVLYNCAADYEGVISVKNKCTEYPNEAALVYWVTGMQAACAVNESCLNRTYNGEYSIDCDYTQSELEQSIDSGELILHKVGSDLCVLADINTLVTETDTKGDVFKENQTIRVIDQIANDIATLFCTKYLGVIPNDDEGRISLWNDIVRQHEELQTLRAIENFTDEDITVAQGDSKKSVVVTDMITVVNAMEQLYMTVTVQ